MRFFTVEPHKTAKVCFYGLKSNSHKNECFWTNRNFSRKILNIKLLFQLTGDFWRTPTFDWIRDELPPENTELNINGEKYITNDYVSTREVTGMLCYHRNKNDHCDDEEVCDLGDQCVPVSICF